MATLLFLLYCAIPTLALRCSHIYTQCLNKTDKTILLTFDDGPDPRYTERLLNILAHNNVRVIFFLVAEKAKKNPELVRRILTDGHLVGFHSSKHTFQWFARPASVKKDFSEGLEVLKGLGCQVNYYRPPWGLFSLTSIFLVRKYHLTTVLWTTMAGDWQKKSRTQRILKKLMKSVKQGAIICLHDSGCGVGSAEGAPEYTLQAVQNFLPAMKNKGYQFVLPG